MMNTKYELDRERVERVLIIEFLTALYAQDMLTATVFKQLMSKVDQFVYEGTVE